MVDSKPDRSVAGNNDGALPVTIYSDVICPWCYVGKRRFEAALRAADMPRRLEISWRPFELNPDMPAAGMGARSLPGAQVRPREGAAERSADDGDRSRGRHRVRLRQNAAHAQYAAGSPVDLAGRTPRPGSAECARRSAVQGLLRRLPRHRVQGCLARVGQRGRPRSSGDTRMRWTRMAASRPCSSWKTKASTWASAGCRISC